MTRDDVVNEARSWIGTPFKHQGRVKGIGVDCVGLVIGVAKNLNLEIKDVTGYSRRPQGFMILQELDAQGVRVTEALPGDVYLMRFLDEPQHVGIASDIGIIHAYSAARKCVEHSMDEVWRKRVVAIFRFKEFA